MRNASGNGSVYDPVVGRFLSPDPFVQNANYADGYNRYAYCLNNPLNYTDPSGYVTEATEKAYINSYWYQRDSHPSAPGGGGGVGSTLGESRYQSSTGYHYDYVSNQYVDESGYRVSFSEALDWAINKYYYNTQIRTREFSTHKRLVLKVNITGKLKLFTGRGLLNQKLQWAHPRLKINISLNLISDCNYIPKLKYGSFQDAIDWSRYLYNNGVINPANERYYNLADIADTKTFPHTTNSGMNGPGAAGFKTGKYDWGYATKKLMDKGQYIQSNYIHGFSLLSDSNNSYYRIHLYNTRMDRAVISFTTRDFLAFSDLLYYITGKDFNNLKNGSDEWTSF